MSFCYLESCVQNSPTVQFLVCQSRGERLTVEMSKNLNDAAMAGNLKEVEMRLNMGEDVNQTQFPRYTTALHDATACGRIEVARLLIKR